MRLLLAVGLPFVTLITSEEWVDAVSLMKTEADFGRLVDEGAVVILEQGTLAEVLEENFGLRARVRVRGGVHSGIEGWVPSVWTRPVKGFRQQPKPRRHVH